MANKNNDIIKLRRQIKKLTNLLTFYSILYGQKIGDDTETVKNKLKDCLKISSSEHLSREIKFKMVKLILSS